MREAMVLNRVNRYKDLGTVYLFEGKDGTQVQKPT
jgi:hypothetical protein